MDAKNCIPMFKEEIISNVLAPNNAQHELVQNVNNTPNITADFAVDITLLMGIIISVALTVTIYSFYKYYNSSRLK